MIPFTRDQFFTIFAVYNSDVWPAAVIAYLLAFGMLALIWRRGASSGRTTALMLALMWAWVGVVYHGLYFSRINLAAPLFGAAFVVQAVLFTWAAFTGRALASKRPTGVRLYAGWGIILYALVAYPVIGLLAGERYPAMPLFVAPCPLVIFTFGIFILANCKRWWFWIVPILWSMIGANASVSMSVPQDIALPLTAILALFLTVRARPPAVAATGAG